MSSNPHKKFADLLEEIELYLAARKMGANYFGQKAVGNSDLVPRLRNGGRVWPETEEKVRQYIQRNPVQRVPHD